MRGSSKIVVFHSVKDVSHRASLICPGGDCPAAQSDCAREIPDRWLARIMRWRVPPNWGPRDWSDEIRAIARAASWQASREFDPSRAVPFEWFVRHRILQAAYQRYRQEWRYALRCGGELAVTEPDGPLDLVAEGPLSPSECRAALEGLSDRDRRLIELLFWKGLTQGEVASMLGISQQAVSKRMHAVLSRLRLSIKRLDLSVVASADRCISPH